MSDRLGLSDALRIATQLSSALPACPNGDSEGMVKNGFIRNGKQNHLWTDCWDTYAQVIPGKRHRAVGKETRQTNRIERFNCTLRQRVSRLVRKTLSFSNFLENERVRFGTLFTITTNPYLFRTTNQG